MGDRGLREFASYLVFACVAVVPLVTGCRGGPEDTRGQDSRARAVSVKIVAAESSS